MFENRKSSSVIPLLQEKKCPKVQSPSFSTWVLFFLLEKNTPFSSHKRISSSPEIKIIQIIKKYPPITITPYMLPPFKESLPAMASLACMHSSIHQHWSCYQDTKNHSGRFQEQY